ncbi:MAG: anthrone oxygenase family protein [Planctomycetota bacterium]
MPDLAQTLLLLASLGSGLVAGLCFAFWTFLMRAYDRLGPTQAIRTMQSVNATILQSAAMPVWIGTFPVGIAAAVFAPNHPPAIAGALLYALGALAITRLGNIPLNEALDRIDPESNDASDAWRHYYVTWGRWNAARTAVCAGAGVAFAWAV